MVGVSAGIAAYKITHLVRQLSKAGHTVKVIPTENSLNFVGKTTWQALTGHPITTSVFDDSNGVEHVELAREAELIILAPATADLLARLRAGRADDLLTTTVLAATCPIVAVPAMHTAMYENPATQENLAVLKQRGYHIIEPVTGDLSSGDHGKGRLPEPEDIYAQLTGNGQANASLTSVDAAACMKPMTGIKVFITAGGTFEPIDPVRYIGNHSTGTFGCALAAAYRDAGATVTLISANIHPSLHPQGVEIIEAPSAMEMYTKTMELAPQYQIGVFAAAVADFRPETKAENKVKKTEGEGQTLTLKLIQNPDILASAVTRFPHLTTLGFAAETGTADQVAQYGRDKAKRKGADLLALNQVGEGIGFGNVETSLTILNKQGEQVTRFYGSKTQIAPQLVALTHATYQRKNS